jgi:hypothetical protein
MPEHPFHLKIGKLVNGLGLLPDKIWKDPACDTESTGVVTLFHSVGSERVRFCLVDMLITLPNKVVIIEIEESNVKPVHIFGKFFASAFSTHYGETEIVKLPLLFIQILDSSKLKQGKTKKKGQWERIEAILINHAKKWPDRTVRYKLFRGGVSEFEPESATGEGLLQLIRDFL